MRTHLGRMAARRLAVVGVVLTLMAPGCGTAPPEDLRLDLEPLVSRFSGLGHPTSATWLVWDNNSDRLSAPGPSTYWIHAIVELEEQHAEDLRAGTSGEDTPTVREALRPHLPPGPFLVGDELDAALGGRPTWTVTGYLQRSGNQLVLTGLAPA